MKKTLTPLSRVGLGPHSDYSLWFWACILMIFNMMLTRVQLINRSSCTIRHKLGSTLLFMGENVVWSSSRLPNSVKICYTIVEFNDTSIFPVAQSIRLFLSFLKLYILLTAVFRFLTLEIDFLRLRLMLFDILIQEGVVLKFLFSSK